MDSWEKFDEKKLPEREDFHSQFNIEDINYADYAHAKKVYKDFEIKKLGEYLDLHLKSDVLRLADVFENF